MNAKQEILDELYYFDTVQPHIPVRIVDSVENIREILSENDLVPVGRNENLRAYIAEIVGLACASEIRVSDAVERILPVIPPIDSRPFDPTLCGFGESRTDEWYFPKPNQFTGVLISRNTGDRISIHRSGDWRNHASGVYHGPWPTQSDGETLLRLLGVLV